MTQIAPVASSVRLCTLVGARVDELERFSVAAIDAGRRAHPQLSGAILVQAERLGAAVAIGLAHQRPAAVGEPEQAARVATQIVP